MLRRKQEKGPAHPGGSAEPFPNRVRYSQPDPQLAYQNASRWVTLQVSPKAALQPKAVIARRSRDALNLVAMRIAPQSQI